MCNDVFSYMLHHVHHNHVPPIHQLIHHIQQGKQIGHIQQGQHSLHIQLDLLINRFQPDQLIHLTQPDQLIVPSLQDQLSPPTQHGQHIILILLDPLREQVLAENPATAKETQTFPSKVSKSFNKFQFLVRKLKTPMSSMRIFYIT